MKSSFSIAILLIIAISTLQIKSEVQPGIEHW
jgi:hypothetical protein